MRARQNKRRSEPPRARVRTGVVGGGALALTLVPAGLAQASPVIAVTNLHDRGTGSLRAAIDAANNQSTTPSAPAVIVFSSNLSGSIDLQTPLPEITQSVDIDGRGARKVTVNAGAVPQNVDVPVLYDDSSGTELTISGLSMDQSEIHGYPLLQVGFANLTLNQDTFATDRSSSTAGAVSTSQNTAAVNGCTFTGDRGTFGGAIFAGDATLTIKDSTLVGNHASRDGGAVFGDAGTVTVVGSTLTGNSVDYAGTSPTEDMYGYGGGLAMSNGPLTLQDSIVAGNAASGNVHYTGHLYGQSDHRDIFLEEGATLSTQFSLIQHDYAGLRGLNPTDLLGVSPDLGPLRNNGGQTNTELPSPKSPVVNAGEAFTLKTDQRGDQRKVEYPGVKKRKGSDGTDIGAVELQLPPKKKHHRAPRGTG